MPGSGGEGANRTGTDPDETLAALGEDRLVSAVVATAARTAPAAGGWLTVGPGDDAAVIALEGPLSVATDTVVQGHDFRFEWSSGADVGVKVAAQNFADVAAMGAAPRALLVSLAAPPELPSAWARGLADGLAEEAGRAGAAVVGGDVSAAAEVVVTGTAIGVHAAGVPPVTRGGARPGDVVALAGRTGASAAGWAVLVAGRGGDPAFAAVVAAHRRPRPPYAAGPAAARAGATAMIDTSDGLLRDAARIAAASGAVLDLDPAALAPGEELLAAAAALGADAAEWVLTGGEDHCLLATFAPGVPLPPGFTRIGTVREGSPGVLVAGRGHAGPAGWHHFSGA